jgi:hypothetical protein
VIHRLTDNPAKAARWATTEDATAAGIRWALAHAPGVRHDVRSEPADDGKGFVVRVFAQGGHPVLDRVGWLKEPRVVRTKRRKVEDDLAEAWAAQ